MEDRHEDSSQPASFLVENIDLLPRGHALDVAMGTGRNAIYLAKVGFEVEGVDISTAAVAAALRWAEKSGVALAAQVANIEGDYRIQESAYDLIVCFNYLWRPLLPAIKGGVRKGGMVVYETFIVDQAHFGRPRNPEYLLKYNELLRMFGDFRCLRYREGIVGGKKALAGIVAERL